MFMLIGRFRQGAAYQLDDGLEAEVAVRQTGCVWCQSVLTRTRPLGLFNGRGLDIGGNLPPIMTLTTER